MDNSDNRVRSYTDEELLKRVKNLFNYREVPSNTWLLFVRSKENLPNRFDDKVYVMQGNVCVMVTSCTTNAGSNALKDYQNAGLSGAFVAKSDMWFYDLWEYGLHRGKMPALRQVSKITGYRDNNKNNLAEEVGKLVTGYFGINFHTVDYRLRPNFFRRLIGGWSWGCFVLNNVNSYLRILALVKTQRRVTACLIMED